MGSQYRKTKLTQTTVDRAEPEAARYILTDTVIPGFWLVVEPSGRKTFKLRYRVGGGRKGTVREPKIGEAAAVVQCRAVTRQRSGVLRFALAVAATASGPHTIWRA